MSSLSLDISCERLLNKVSIIGFPLLWLPSQLVANALLFVCVNCVGIFHLWMTEHDLRISNQKREEFSAIRSQKEIKKYQQVKRHPHLSVAVSDSEWFLYTNDLFCFCQFTHSHKSFSAALNLKSMCIIALIKGLFTWMAWVWSLYVFLAIWSID